MDSSTSIVVIISIILCQGTAYKWHNFSPKWFNDFKDLIKNEVLDNDKIHFPDENDSDYSGSFDSWNAATTPAASDTTPRTDVQIVACISTCPVTLEFKPVCANDGVTFQNIGHLLCAVKCGIGVIMKYPGACLKSDVIKTTVSQKRLNACMNICPTTSEYNPVCGTDNVTYRNIGKLYCAKMCGAGVELQRQFPCPLTTTTPSSETNTNAQIQTCISTCPVSFENNPVCGSNFVTYENIGKLQCASSCGIDVTLQASMACFLLTTLPPPASTTTEQSLGQYQNPSAPTQSNHPTIPQDILDSIFKSPEV